MQRRIIGRAAEIAARAAGRRARAAEIIYKIRKLRKAAAVIRHIDPPGVTLPATLAPVTRSSCRSRSTRMVSSRSSQSIRSKLETLATRAATISRVLTTAAAAAAAAAATKAPTTAPVMTRARTMVALVAATIRALTMAADPDQAVATTVEVAAPVAIDGGGGGDD